MRGATPGVIEISTTILCQKNASFGNLDLTSSLECRRLSLINKFPKLISYLQ